MPENARTPSKSSEVAPAHSASHTPRRIDEHIVESKLNLKPKALASEQIFPTLEGLAEEQGLDIERRPDDNEDSPESKKIDENKAEAPAAWQGKLPEAVKQDGEFTQAEIIFIDEPAERAAELAKKEEENTVKRETEKHLGADATSSDVKHAPAEMKTEPTKENKERERPQRLQPESIRKPSISPSDTKPSRNEEPIADSKLYLKSDTLASEQIFPSLEGVADEHGLGVGLQARKAVAEDVLRFADAPLARQDKRPSALKRASEPTESKERPKTQQGPFRWFKGEPRETSVERLFVRGASGFLGVGLSIVCGFLRIFGLRDLSGRLVMKIRRLSVNIVEGTFLRHLTSFAHQWWIYRLVERVVRNIDRNVRVQIGPEPAKKDTPIESKEDYKNLRLSKK